MAYCDHKCIDTCPDCIDEIIKLRKRVRELEETIKVGKIIEGVLANESIRNN